MSNNTILKVDIEEVYYENNEKPVLKNINFEVKEGEIVLIHGKSGSGKTTLLRAIAGLIGKVVKGKFKGSIELEDTNIYSAETDWIDAKIAYVPQEIWYSILNPIVRRELEFSLLNTLEKNINRIDLEQAIRSAAEKFGIENLLERNTFTLSSGELQRTKLASSHLKESTILFLMDEPTTYIEKNSRKMIPEYLMKFLGEKRAAIVVDHDIELWRDKASKILHLENGTIKNNGENLDYIGNYSLVSWRKERKNIRSSETIIEASKLCFKFPLSNSYLFKNITFKLGQGEIMWIRGKNGSGKTTLLKILAGIYKPSCGTIKKKTGMAYIPENPLLFFSYPTVKEELGNIDSYSREIISILEIENTLDKKLAQTSSGERRRIAIASSIIKGYGVIGLDEPTAGMDYWTKTKIIELIYTVASEKKKSFIIASHDEMVGEISNKQLNIEDYKT